MLKHCYICMLYLVSTTIHCEAVPPHQNVSCFDPQMFRTGPAGVVSMNPVQCVNIRFSCLRICTSESEVHLRRPTGSTYPIKYFFLPFMLLSVLSLPRLVRRPTEGRPLWGGNRNSTYHLSFISLGTGFTEMAFVTSSAISYLSNGTNNGFQHTFDSNTTSSSSSTLAI